MQSFSRVLVIAPHTDDGELGCGGSIVKFLEQGTEVYYAAFSVAEKSVPPGFPKNALEIELKNATKVLGIGSRNLAIYRYEVRTFSYHRQEILEDIIALRNDLKPDVVFIPSLNDLHQDHKVIAEEGVRAFRKSAILSYEEPWNNMSFNTASFIILGERHVQKKVEALKHYETQKHRSYFNEEFIRSLARTRGTQIETEYAEAFEVIRWVIK